MNFPIYFGRLMESEWDGSIKVWGYCEKDGRIVTFKNKIQAMTHCKYARESGKAAPDARVKCYDLNIEARYFLFDEGEG